MMTWVVYGYQMMNIGGDLKKDSEEQAVIVTAHFSATDADAVFEQLTELENQLVKAIDEAAMGEFDGNEIGNSDVVLYMYGADAEKLFLAIESILQRTELMDGAVAMLRFGPPGAPSRLVQIGAR